ncbi:MAG: GtrA family protein [Burkholderiales bacterium]|jgi:putative flippase GtrA|nr:GtrA family protein [Burkholderiales bacterium]
MSKGQSKTFLLYATVGGAATAAHYLVLAVMVELAAVAAGTAAAIGALCGAAVAYLGNRRFAFAGSDTPHLQAIPRFALVAAVGVGLSAAVVGAGTAFTRVHYLAWQVLATGLALLLTYALNRRWTFA